MCEEQNLDSQCHGNTHTTVRQSLADADAILDDAARNKNTCKIATCGLREINNGRAIEINSLTLSLENHMVRLTWSSPVLDDGVDVPRRDAGNGSVGVRRHGGDTGAVRPAPQEFNA